MLVDIFQALVQRGKLREIMDEIILQSRVEFNYEVAEADEDIDADADPDVV